MKSISDYLDEDVKKWGEKPYISTKINGIYSSHSFKNTVDDVKNLSKSLIRRNLKGKNIMIYAENSYEWAVIYFSIMGYVGVCLPVDKEWTIYDIKNIVKVIDVSAVFYSAAKAEEMKKLKASCPQIHCFCIEEDFKQLTATGEGEDFPLAGEKDMHKTVAVLFTSGTTNIPKAIPLTQANLFYNWHTLFKRTPMTESDISYVFLPLNHVYSGVANLLYTIISGMQIYFCSNITQAVAEMLVVRPTVVCTVPLFLQRMYMCMNEEILAMLRGLRFLYCGGSFTDPHIKKYFVDNGVNLLEAYGTTETSSVIALDYPGDANRESNGVIFENLDVKIIDKDALGIGEIIVKGGSVTRGYVNTNNTCSAFDSNGYYHTGDLGIIDDSNHLYLKGRKKRVIITANGKNVYIDEIEQLIRENKAIKAVTVYEEDYHVAASVVSALSERDTRKYIDELNQKLPKYKKIHKLYIREDKPGGRIK